MAGKRLCEAEKRKIAELYHRGRSVDELAKEYNVPRSTVYRWIKDYPASVDRQPGCIMGDLAEMHRMILTLQEENRVLRKAVSMMKMES